MRPTKRKTKYTRSEFDPDTKEYSIYKQNTEGVWVCLGSLSKVQAGSFARHVFSDGLNYMLSGLRWRSRKKKEVSNNG